MTIDDAKRMVPAIKKIDGGCSACIDRFLDHLQQAIPEVDWSDLVWEKCSECGKPNGDIYDTLCWDCLK